jgi:putative membrane protein
MSYVRSSILSTAFAAAVAMLATAPATASAQAQQAGAAKLDDPTICAIFEAANQRDIQTGNLAAKKGSTKEVRELGAMLAHDHTAVLKLATDLAKKLGVTPTPPKNFGMVKDHQDAMKKLDAASGHAFDVAFLQHEIAYHQAVIDAASTTLLPALQNAEVKDLVVKIVPNLQAHKLAAENLLAKITK